ncbi:hypothetical protein [Streptomyces sp. JNUCC 63]
MSGRLSEAYATKCAQAPGARVSCGPSVNPDVPPHAQSAVAANEPHSRANPRPRPRAHGVTHKNTRHTARFTVIGGHLAQHPELSLVATAPAVHIQSLPDDTPVDIKTLADRCRRRPRPSAAAPGSVSLT